MPGPDLAGAVPIKLASSGHVAFGTEKVNERALIETPRAHQKQGLGCPHFFDLHRSMATITTTEMHVVAAVCDRLWIHRRFKGCLRVR